MKAVFRGAQVHLRWFLVAVSFFAMCALWSVATPPMASPDEPAHTIKAVAVAHGQLLGTIGPRPTTWMVPGALTAVEIPADYAVVADLNCFSTLPYQDASCMPKLPDDTTLTQAWSAAGHYPPLYYALVGWPSKFLPAAPGILAMRLVSALLSTIFVMIGLLALRTTSAQRIVSWGAVTALTPMSLFLFATINPNGLEISTAFAAWASTWAIMSSREVVSTRLWVSAGVSFAVLANIRALSPLWAMVILVITVGASGHLGLFWRERRRTLAGSAVFVVLVSLPSLIWAMRYGTLLTGHGLWPQYRDKIHALADMVLALSKQYGQMIGNQGWFDSPVPLLTYLVWTISLGMLFALAMQRRDQLSVKFAIIVLLIGVIVGPMLIQLPSVADAGLVWQGRYTLPIAIGVPLLSAFLLASAGNDPERSVASGIARGMLVALVVGQVLAFYGTARRYAVGDQGSYFTVHPGWTSALGFLPAVCLYTAAVVTFVVALGSVAKGDPDHGVLRLESRPGYRSETVQGTQP